MLTNANLPLAALALITFLAGAVVGDALRHTATGAAGVTGQTQSYFAAG